MSLLYIHSKYCIDTMHVVYTQYMLYIHNTCCIYTVDQVEQNTAFYDSYMQWVILHGFFWHRLIFFSKLTFSKFFLEYHQCQTVVLWMTQYTGSEGVWPQMRVWLQIQGREFDPGQVPYFRGDWSWNNFYGHSPPFRCIIQEGLLSLTSESMCMKYWLTACSSLPRKKCG